MDKPSINIPRVRPQRNHEERLYQALMESARPVAPSRRAGALWKAAYRLVMEPLQSLFEEIEREQPAKVRSPAHWARLVDRLESEVEQAFKSLWNDRPQLVTRSNRLARFAALNGVTSQRCLDIWSCEGNALRRALTDLDINLGFHASGITVVDVCSLCWHTALTSERGALLCNECRRFGAWYANARARLLWRDPTQPAGDYVSFVWHWARQLKPRLPYALQSEPTDHAEMAKLSRGAEISLEDSVRWQVTLADYWDRFPRTALWLQRHTARVDRKDARSVLAALDPPMAEGRRTQVLMHEVMANDHRIFFDRVIFVEACLEADSRRRRKSRTGKGSAEVQTLVVPYTFGYAGLDSLRRI